MNNCIGVFDSGLGGLTVLKELVAHYPASYLYIADTANLPYGSKRPEEIIKISHRIIEYFQQQEIRTCIIACHTACAIALQTVRSSYPDMNIIGVVDQVCNQAVRATRNNKIGILATAATIESHGHKKYIQNAGSAFHVIEQACPDLVPAIEAQAYQESTVITLIDRYIKPMIHQKVDTIILGSTHYALIKDLIQKQVGPEIFLASAEQNIETIFQSTAGVTVPSITVKTTSEPMLFAQRAYHLIGMQLPSIELISL